VRINVLNEDPIGRTEKWLLKVNVMTAAGKRAELARCSKEFFRPPESNMIRLTSEDLDHVPATNDLAEETGDAETAAKVQELMQFIRTRFGQRCAVAARAVMDGCRTGAEIGAKMGVARQTADGHLENIRSEDVQRKAVQLGLVTRASFIESLKAVEAKKAKQLRAAKKVTRKVKRRKSPKSRAGGRRARVA